MGDEGDILLRPQTSIPSRELWVYQNPKALERIKKGLQEAKEGKIKEVKNVRKFLNEL